MDEMGVVEVIEGERYGTAEEIVHAAIDFKAA